MPRKKLGVGVMLDEIRDAISRCTGMPEKEVYEALVVEAEAWQMRLQELELEEMESEDPG